MNFDFTKKNIGTTDRLVRAIVGVLLIVGALRGGWWVAGIIGAVLVVTAFLRVCPGYMPFGFSTNKDVTPEVK